MPIPAPSQLSLPTWLKAMLDPAFYDDPVTKVQLIQTHISWVLLTGPYAYKIKKPVNFGFLDFSSLDKRQAMCRKELELNRRLAPELYLDVLPICKSGDTFRFGPKNDQTEAIEYCLKMIQFDPQALFTNEIEHDDFDPTLMDVLAHQVAIFHLAAEPIQRPPFGSTSILRKYIAENLQTAMELAQHPSYPDLHFALEQGTNRMLQRLESRLEQRHEEGFIRACHGDLHLGNIALVHGSPCIFDCIEFNEELRLIDTMNDTAFLVMDCDARNHPELGLRFLSRYLEFTGDYQGLALLRLYQLYRASVRGKVALLLSEDSAITKQSANAKRQEACRYFELAISYSNADDQPKLYAIGGLSGSGKSHISLLGSRAEHALVIRSDATRKRLGAGRESLYTPSMTQKTYAAMMDGADMALSAGYSVILDATFLNKKYRDQVRELASKHGIPLHMFWLDLPVSELRRRISSRSDAGSDVSDANPAVLNSQLTEYQRPIENDIRFLSSSDAWPYITSTA